MKKKTTKAEPQAQTNESGRKVHYNLDNDRRLWALLTAEYPDGTADLNVYVPDQNGDETVVAYQGVPRGENWLEPGTWHE